jgi:hypothetical protein
MLQTIQLIALGYLVWKMRWYYGSHEGLGGRNMHIVLMCLVRKVRIN